MKIKCIGGPMDGAVYTLSKVLGEQSTNRKPDGLWFDSEDKHGRRMREEYTQGDCLETADEHVVVVFNYDGQCVITGSEFSTRTK